MLPRIANGPIANISEALTKPSTNGDAPFGSNLDFNFSPAFSSLASILSTDPTIAPSNNAPSTVNRVQPVGTAFTKSTFQIEYMAAAPEISVINPRTSVIKFLVSYLNFFPSKIPISEPKMIATIFIIVPKPGKIMRISKSKLDQLLNNKLQMDKES